MAWDMDVEGESMSRCEQCGSAHRREGNERTRWMSVVHFVFDFDHIILLSILSSVGSRGKDVDPAATLAINRKWNILIWLLCVHASY